MKPEFKKHQIEAIEFLSKRRSAFIQYEMGLGKTLIMLQHLEAKREALSPILVVCPKNVVPVWRNESLKWGYNLSVTDLVGSSLERIKALSKESDVYVINYEGLRFISPQLLAKKFKTIVLDESHRIKDRKSKQTAVALMLAEKATFKYAMSGTPYPKSPEDLWSQIYFLHKQYLPNYFVFCSKYIDYKKFTITTNKGRKEIRKALHFKKSMLPELQAKLSAIVLRRTKKECLDLPEKIYQRIEVELTPEQKRVYLAIRDGIMQTFKDGGLDKATAAASVAKLQQVCQGFLYDSDGNFTTYKSCKIEALKDLLEDMEGMKVIVFTYFKADIEIIKKEIGGDRELLIYEGNDKEREEIIRKFQEEDRPYVFVSNVERAKEGITLTASSHLIYYGNSCSYGTRAQSEDRPHRIGQKNTVNYYDIIAKDTADERVTKILLDKKEMADSITGDSIRIAMMEIEQLR